MELPSLLTNFSRDTFTWLAVTVLLGGAAAVATGRALAQAWLGRGRAIVYAAVLAAAAGFLSYALFEVSAIPMQDIASAALERNFPALASLLSVWAATFVILALFAAAGWRITRNRMMSAQYGFRDAPPALKTLAPEADLQA